MTTHQLATLIEHLRQGFGESLAIRAGNDLTEIVAVFRELPDQPLKDLAKSLRKANAPPPTPTGNASPSTGVSGPGAIERIRAIRNGTIPVTEGVDVGRLTNPQLKDVLREFGQAVSGTKPELVARIRQLCVPTATPNNPAPTAPPAVPTTEPRETGEFDPRAVEEGVRIYSELRDDRKLTIADVRAGFEKLRTYPKSVVEEISRRLKYTPFGSRTDILDRLLSNLEGIKMSQYKMDQILTGT